MKLHPWAERIAIGMIMLGALSIVVPVVAFLWVISQSDHLPCYFPGW